MATMQAAGVLRGVGEARLFTYWLVEREIGYRVGQLLGAAAEVYVDTLPQSPTYPVALVHLITEPPSLYTLKGRTRNQTALIQVDVLAHETSGGDPYYEATRLAQIVNGTDDTGLGLSGMGLSGFRGDIRGGRITGIFRQDRRRNYDPDELRIVTISQDYQVFYIPPN